MSDNINNQFDFFQAVQLDADGNLMVSIANFTGDYLPLSGGTLTGDLNVDGELNVSGLTSFAIIGGDANGYDAVINGGDANFPVFSTTSDYYPYVLNSGTTFTFTGQITTLSIASLTQPLNVYLPTSPYNQIYIVKDKSGNAGLFPITISSVGNTINGETNYIINLSSKPSITFLWDGTEYITI